MINEKHTANQELLDFLMQSDSENIEFQSIQRMSELSKVNLFGLVLLSELICEHKLS